MDFNLSKEQELIQRAAREFAEKYIEPIAQQIDQENASLKRSLPV